MLLCRGNARTAISHYARKEMYSVTLSLFHHFVCRNAQHHANLPKSNSSFFSFFTFADISFVSIITVCS